MNVFIFGAGYSARAFGEANNGRATLSGTTRSEAKFRALEASGIHPLLFDGTTLTPEIVDALRRTTHLVISIAPGETGDPALALMPDLRAAMPQLGWIGYLSTVGVYGDHGGAWIDETTPTSPKSRRSIERVDAENAWVEAGRRVGVPVALLRLSGIYGPGRNAFVNLEAGTAKRLIKPGQVFNRIHVDDIAGALWHLAGQKAGGAFNVTDDRPAPPQDVVTHAAELMGVTPPPETPFDGAEMSAMARSFYGENKRVANSAIKKAGYRFQFPDYETALGAMWRSRSWKGSEARPVRSPIRN